jgi:hypothetical protein
MRRYTGKRKHPLPRLKLQLFLNRLERAVSTHAFGRLYARYVSPTAVKAVSETAEKHAEQQDEQDQAEGITA